MESWLGRRYGMQKIRAAAALFLMTILTGSAMAAEPVKIGFSMALTGSYAGNGRAALVAIELWAEDQNAKGGLLGRPVKLIYYDDQSNPSQVPAIYTKLLDLDKVDLLLSGYGTNVIAAALPVVMERDMVLMSVFGLAVNDQFHYGKYFQVQPNGPNARATFSQGFFEVAMTLDPKPKTVAVTATDSEFPKTASEGARAWAKKYGLKIVYDRSFPPTTIDFAPVMRAIQATQPDIVYIACFPPDTVGIVRSAKEIGFKAQLVGGGMVGPQYASVKQQLGQSLNGLMTFEVYVPEPTLKFPGLEALLAHYTPKATAAGVDPLGYYLPPYVYAGLQMLGAAVEATKGLDQTKIAAYLHDTEHSTLVGNVRYGPDGEWSDARILQVQYQGIQGNDLEQFKQPGRQVILYPTTYKSGTVQHPYSEIQR